MRVSESSDSTKRLQSDLNMNVSESDVILTNKAKQYVTLTADNSDALECDARLDKVE